MNFTLLFAVAAHLSFSVDYEANADNQDYFFFSSLDNTAHLFKRDNTVHLFLGQNDSREIYKYANVTNNFKFSWEGYKVNNKKMHLAESNGKIDKIFFDSFTFMSPIITLYNYYNPEPLPVYSSKEFNY